MMSLSTRPASLCLLLLATTGLTAAWNATDYHDTTISVWNPETNAYQPTDFELNVGVVYGSERIPSSPKVTDLQYTVSEDIWLADTQGYSICTAPYTLCALAFTGGIGNDSLIAQMQGDTGDCATAFSPTCIGDLKAALGNAILDQANTNRTDGEMCRALSSEIVIPRSCGGISSVLNESISEALFEQSSFCGVHGSQPFPVKSVSGDAAHLGTVLGAYDKFIVSFTPVLLIAFGGPNGTQVVADNPGETRSLTCVRPRNVAKGARYPGGASTSSRVSGVLVGGTVALGVLFLLF